MALGVSVYLAIQIANHSANQSFAASIDLVAGKANLEARAASGNFDENLLPKLTHAPGVKAATPLVEGYATLPDYPGEYLQVLGMDIYTNLPFATFAVGGQSTRRMGQPRSRRLAGRSARAGHHGRFCARARPESRRSNCDSKSTAASKLLTVRFLIRLTDTAAGTR